MSIVYIYIPTREKLFSNTHLSTFISIAVSNKYILSLAVSHYHIFLCNHLYIYQPFYFFFYLSFYLSPVSYFIRLINLFDSLFTFKDFFSFLISIEITAT